LTGNPGVLRGEYFKRLGEYGIKNNLIKLQMRFPSLQRGVRGDLMGGERKSDFKLKARNLLKQGTGFFCLGAV
jgi:hypothetical protein